MSWRPVFAVVCCALAVWLLPAVAEACAPRPIEACALVNNDADVFIARVLPQKSSAVDWKLQVVRSFRGTARGVIDVDVWSTGGTQLPATIEPGKVYLFYVSRHVEPGATVRSTPASCATWLALDQVSRTELDFLGRLRDTTLDARVAGSLLLQTRIAREPLPDVRIVLQSETGTFSTVTDDRGRFEIGGLPAGTYEVLTTAPPELRVTVAGPVNVVPHGCADVALIATSDAIVTMRGFATMHIRVIYADGSPASGVHVAQATAPSRPRLDALFRTAADGSLELPVAPDTEFWVQASRFAPGVDCRSDYLWFNSEGGVRWQHGAHPATPPEWRDGQASAGELVLRLDGATCTAPAR